MSDVSRRVSWRSATLTAGVAGTIAKAAAAGESKGEYGGPRAGRRGAADVPVRSRGEPGRPQDGRRLGEAGDGRGAAGFQGPRGRLDAAESRRHPRAALAPQRRRVAIHRPRPGPHRRLRFRGSRPGRGLPGRAMSATSPAATATYIENVGDEPLRVLIGFNSGDYQEISLSPWLAANPEADPGRQLPDRRLDRGAAAEATCLHRRQGRPGGVSAGAAGRDAAASVLLSIETSETSSADRRIPARFSSGRVQPWRQRIPFMDDRKGPMACVSAGWLHHHFLALLFASYAAAALWPGPGLAIRKLSLGQVGLGSIHTDASLPLIMLACLLFNAGLGVNTSQLGGFLRRPRTLAAGLSANILFPIVFILSVSWWMQHWHNLDEVAEHPGRAGPGGLDADRRLVNGLVAERRRRHDAEPRPGPGLDVPQPADHADRPAHRRVRGHGRLLPRTCTSWPPATPSRSWPSACWRRRSWASLAGRVLGRGAASPRPGPI